MLEVSAYTYLLLGGIKEKIIKRFDDGTADAEMVSANLKVLKNHCDELGLTSSSNLLTRAIVNLPQTAREFEIYFSAISSEIDSHLFFHVPSNRAKYYNQYASWLKNNLEWLTALPEPALELDRAGNCYAFGEYTACVFHSMRAAEIGLRTFAAFLEIPLDEPVDQMPWGKIVGKIEKAIEEKSQTRKSPERDEELRYCSQAAAQFRYFNLGWRVFVAHAKEIYDEDQAVKIMTAVTEFLQVLPLKGEPKHEKVG